jgi:hypothetical protein
VQHIPDEFALHQPLHQAPAVFEALLAGTIEAPKVVLLP